MAQLHLPHMSETIGWEKFTHVHLSVLKLFVFYWLPLAIVPPAMIYYAGVTYGGHLLPELSIARLTTIGIVFYLTELVMSFVMANVIQRFAEFAEIKAPFDDAYKLAVVIPAPLCLAPLFLFIPSFMLNLSVAAAALILSGILIYYSVPPILKVEERGHAILLSGTILTAGMVAWAAMMYLTLLTWGFGLSL